MSLREVWYSTDCLFPADESDESSPHQQHPSHISPHHQHPSQTSPDANTQATPTGDCGNSAPDKPAHLMEPDLKDSKEREGGAVGGERGREEDSSLEEVSDSGKATSGLRSRSDEASRSAQPVEPRPSGPHRESRGPAVCRHFLQGTCVYEVSV